jgi:hypothetical protein
MDRFAWQITAPTQDGVDSIWVTAKTWLGKEEATTPSLRGAAGAHQSPSSRAQGRIIERPKGSGAREDNQLLEWGLHRFALTAQQYPDALSCNPSVPSEC